MSLSAQQTPLQALDAMGLSIPQPTLVVIGGASFMSPESLDQLQTVFDRVLAPLAQELGLTVLDGGTDAGVIRMMGRARFQINGRFPLIGVVPQGKAKLPNGDSLAITDDSRHELEPHHTNFFLIPGQDWGSESPWLVDLATHISASKPALTILINGGKVALTDLRANLSAGRSTLVMAGSGRLADEVATAMTGDLAAKPQLLELVQEYQPSGKLELISFDMPMDEMHNRIHQYFVDI
ncbi:MAG: hypothetical protein HC929_13630 [Leptolyngbyaceae cyanobacterium SM2_5_2]|nr:hypothetical protein [Leptolyngbyaceae cyanobacterium SM2_5_2]